MAEVVVLNEEHVADIVRQQFPTLPITSVTYLGEGCDSSAFDVNETWVFRFPKRQDVEQQLLLEWRVLPVLADHSPLHLPRFCFHGQPSASFPRHFGGYPKLPGVPAIRLDPNPSHFAAWARPLGRFLSWLHAFPVAEAARLGVAREDDDLFIEEVRAEALDDFERLNQVAPHAPLDEWLAYLSVSPMAASGSASPMLVHRDLSAEHVLCDVATQEPTGVIDWSEIAISDNAVDLACMLHWGGEDLLMAFLAHYRGPFDASTRDRARFLAVCRGVTDVAFGLDNDRPEYVGAGLRALRLCAPL